MDILTFLVTAILTCWYLREPRAERTSLDHAPNLNAEIDEWNAREMVEESESL